MRNSPRMLLHIDPADLQAIMIDLQGPRRGQKRVNELFLRVHNRIIGRGVVANRCAAG